MRGEIVEDRSHPKPAHSPLAQADRSFQSPIATVLGDGSVQHGLSAAGASLSARASVERQINAIRLHSTTCGSTCKLSAFEVYSRLLRGAIGEQIDGMDGEGIWATRSRRCAPEPASEDIDGKYGGNTNGQRVLSH